MKELDIKELVFVEDIEKRYKLEDYKINFIRNGLYIRSIRFNGFTLGISDNLYYMNIYKIKTLSSRTTSLYFRTYNDMIKISDMILDLKEVIFLNDEKCRYKEGVCYIIDDIEGNGEAMIYNFNIVKFNLENNKYIMKVGD
jgi:hypothetical protein